MPKNILSKLKTAKVSKDHKKTSHITTLDLVMSDPAFRLYRKALKLTGLIDLLTDGNMYTIYAPTDDAFLALGDPTVDFLFRRGNLEYLKQLLLYHFSPKVYSYSSLFNYLTVPTLLGVRMPITTLSIDTGDIRLTDSLVHTVNRFAVPSFLEQIIYV